MKSITLPSGDVAYSASNQPIATSNLADLLDQVRSSGERAIVYRTTLPHRTVAIATFTPEKGFEWNAL